MLACPDCWPRCCNIISTIPRAATSAWNASSRTLRAVVTRHWKPARRAGTWGGTTSNPGSTTSGVSSYGPTVSSRSVSAPHERGRCSKVDRVRAKVLRRGQPLSISEVEEACPAVSRDKVRLVLRAMKSEGVIESMGKGRVAKWKQVKVGGGE